MIENDVARTKVHIFQYLHSPTGLLKLLHIIFGGVSLVLICTSFVPVLKLKLLLGTVSTCLGISVVYLLAHFFFESLWMSKTNRVINFLYHILGGLVLIAAGINLIGWSEYGSDCGDDSCPNPNLYPIGVAKILTFINGTLYEMVGFLEIKEEDMLEFSEEEDNSDEDVPLLNPSKELCPHNSRNNSCINADITVTIS